MTELLTAAQMRAIEQAAIASGEVTGLELMERAGRGVVEAIFEEWPELRKTSHRAVVLCGPGNNGGDGFVVARLLHDWGWEVEVFLYGDEAKLPPDARVNYGRWCERGEARGPSTSDNDLKANLVVDAIFGTGLTRTLKGDYATVVDRMARCCGPDQLVAIDIRSGLCADSGTDLSGKLDGVVEAGLTVAFHRRKIGHYLATGAEACGKVVVADIGLSEGKGRKRARLWRERVHLTARTATVRKDTDEHKFSHGHALILSGPASKTGAARLAARGALRIGAGLVTVGCPRDALAEHAAQLNAIMLREVADAVALEEVLRDRRINARCLGPGMGVGEATRGMVRVALTAPASAPGPRAEGERSRIKSGKVAPKVVLDADALTSFEADPRQLFDMLHENCVLTPHGGEFARLFPDIAEKLNATPTKGPAYSKVDATREAASRAGCVVLFKGPDTVIAAPNGQCAINSAHYERSAPWLATAGSGDVLAGFITGLLARGFQPMDAAETAAWLHVECALKFGPGLIAEDIPEQLPLVFRELGV